MWTADSVSCQCRAWAGRGWLLTALLVSPWPPVMVTAEMPVFVFPSFPSNIITSRECIHMFQKEHLPSSLSVAGTTGNALSPRCGNRGLQDTRTDPLQGSCQPLRGQQCPGGQGGQSSTTKRICGGTDGVWAPWEVFLGVLLSYPRTVAIKSTILLSNCVLTFH